VAGHTALAGQQGYTDEQLASLGAPLGGQELFDPAVRAALTYATLMTRDAHQVTDAFFADLKKHYTDSQIVELTSVVGLTNYWNRFTTALRIDLSGSDEAY
jgi:alkylhydroperoxidase family enzyme